MMNKRDVFSFFLTFLPGVGKKKPAMITGGSVIYWPGLQTYSRYVVSFLAFEVYKEQ